MNQHMGQANPHEPCMLPHALALVVHHGLHEMHGKHAWTMRSSPIYHVKCQSRGPCTIGRAVHLGHAHAWAMHALGLRVHRLGLAYRCQAWFLLDLVLDHLTWISLQWAKSRYFFFNIIDVIKYTLARILAILNPICLIIELIGCFY